MPVTTRSILKRTTYKPMYYNPFRENVKILMTPELFISLVNKHFVHYYGPNGKGSRNKNSIPWFRERQSRVYYARIIFQYANENIRKLLLCDPKTWRPIAKIIHERAIMFDNEDKPIISGTLSQMLAYLPNSYLDSFRSDLAMTLKLLNCF
jgi:hypothetical protein